MGDGEEEERRETAIASTTSSSLQPKPKAKAKAKGSVTHQQLSKFQELHRRRLQIQIKSKSKIKKNKKGATAKSQIKHHPTTTTSDEVNEAQHSRFSTSDAAFGENGSHVQQDNAKTTLPSKRLQKLHWGLDTKEPWERKANM